MYVWHVLCTVYICTVRTYSTYVPHSFLVLQKQQHPVCLAVSWSVGCCLRFHHFWASWSGSSELWYHPSQTQWHFAAGSVPPMSKAKSQYLRSTYNTTCTQPRGATTSTANPWLQWRYQQWQWTRHPFLRGCRCGAYCGTSLRVKQCVFSLAVTHQPCLCYFKPPHDAGEGFNSCEGGDLQPQWLAKKGKVR